MRAEEIESLLAGLPVRKFSPAQEAQVLAAVLAAHPRARRWWQHSVPLWQAAAAVLLAVAAGVATHGRTGVSQPSDAARMPAVSPTLSTPAVTRSDCAYVLDIRRWQVLAATTQGVPQ